MGAIHYKGHNAQQDLLFFVLLGLGAFFMMVSLALICMEWAFEKFFRLLLSLLICLTAGSILVTLAQRFTSLPLDSKPSEQWVIAEGIFLIFFNYFLRARKTKWADAFGLSHNLRHAVLYGIALACIFLPISQGLQWGSYHFMNDLRLQPQEQEAVRALRVSNAWTDRAVLGVHALFLAPVVEEMFFRGLFYPVIKQSGFPRLAFWGVSLLFAIIHFNLVSFIPLFVLAVLLTSLYEYTDNLLASISAHALFNALNFALLYLFQKQFGGK